MEREEVPMELADATVLVTGSSRGIGLAIARRLRARHARVILHGRDTRALEAAARELRARCVAVDLLEPDGVDLLAQRVGTVDGLVHCAGIGWRGDVARMPRAEVAAVLALDLQVPIELTRLLLPAMIAAGRGHICFVGSIAGLTGVAHEAVYSASKAGVLTFADSLRLELEGTGVEVSTISPGAVTTDFCSSASYPRRVPRPISADRVAAAVVAGMHGERAPQILPRWLAVAPKVRAVSPSAFHRLARRFG